MANLKTDSALSRRIVRAFLDFLDSVEPAPGVDVEGLEVSRECLSDAFKLNLNSADDPVEPGLLVNLFRSLPSRFGHRAGASQSRVHQDEDWTRQPGGTGVSNDELFGQFFAALEKHHFFKATPDGKDDAIQLDKATRLFHGALNEMEKTGCQSFDTDTLAEALKSQGNREMKPRRYHDAIELYSCAIALSENKAVYYCNRAAAYTQVFMYSDAIRDCLKCIDIDPNYSKAYSRLGLIYYALGSYRDAIDKGFKKALQLDPSNESIIDNIRVSEEKLKEQSWSQNSSTSSTGIPPFGAMPFDPSSIPVNLANMMRNAVHPEQRQGEASRGNPADEQQQQPPLYQPGVGGGNVNVDVADMMPDDLRGVLGSVMGMFTGAAPPPPAGGSNGEQPSNSRPPPAN